MFKTNKILAIFLALFITFSSCISAFAYTPEQDSINSNKVKYDEINSEITELNSKLAAFDVEIETMTNNLKENNNKLNSITDEINFTKNMLEKTAIEIEESQKKIDARIRTVYKTNLNTNLLIFILTSESFSDFFSRMSSVSRIISFDKKLMNEVEEKQQKLNENIDKLKKDEESLKNLEINIKNSLSELENKRKSQQEIIDKLNNEKASIFSIIEANEEKLIQHPLSIINSSGSSISDISNAIMTLEALIPQLNSPYVIGLAEDAIYKGNLIISEANIPTPPGDITTGNAIATYTMESTAYTGGGVTATGLKPIRDPNGISTVAVDPNVIPLGSKVHVSGYGVAIASDTGGAIKGNKIDVYLNTHAECISWGRRSVTVTLLAYPGEW